MSEGDKCLKRTPLYDIHLENGGKMVDFGGWELPIQYSGIINEHRTVREAAGLFDVSHMGEILVYGEQALDLLQELVTNDVSLIEINQVQYTPMCNDDGGIIDDLIIYRLAADKFMLVVNAANTEKDYNRVCEVSRDFPGAEISNISWNTALIAIQGPLACKILSRECDQDIEAIKYFRFLPEVTVCGEQALVSRTGYTGEDGFEIYCSRESAPVIWKGLARQGAEYNLVPAGLGARDTLRFEACLPLYGNELDEDANPLEAGLTPFVKLYKPSFRGKENLTRVKHEGLKRRLVGLEVTGRGIPRQGYPVLHGSEFVGKITSGTYAPTLDKNLGLAYVAVDYSEPGTDLFIDIRGRKVEARVVSIPFYKRRR
ncbi:MAG: glycine cleavage system aminomethyltransferase GcvT [Bacillota bacterium]